MSKLLGFLVCFIIVSVSCGRLEPEYLTPRVEAYNAAPRSYSGAPISFDLSNNGDGTYRFSYETDTGISAHESGSPRASGPEGPAVTAEGGYSYRAPDGQQISLSYTADEHGFHPVGSHIPTPPPIPEAILRSIELNRQHASGDDGSYNSAVYDN